ncbi:hypothetical protein HOA91_04475 [Candidatus Woesearchaeota archaeon]|jgi:hypothetical protein|nr:hypothetical protein [Candidatus Woesearchaeota archaeon]
MNKHIKNYLNSFKFNNKYWYTLFIDGFTFLFITLLFLGLGKILEMKAYAISNGKTTEELKVLLLSGSVENSKLFLDNVKIFTFYLVIGILLALIVALLVYSLSRNIVWNKLLKRDFVRKKFWAWNGLSVLMIIILFFYLLFYKVIEIFLPLGVTMFQFIFRGLVGSTLVLIFMVFLFLVNYSFATENKVWFSIGNAFHLIKLNWKRLWKMFILTLITWVLLRVLLYYIYIWFKIIPQELFSSILNITAILLFLVWLRLYLLRTIGRRELT